MPAMRCPECFTEVGVKAKFCRGCGARLGGASAASAPTVAALPITGPEAGACPECGASLSRQVRFCPQCGRAAAEERGLAPPVAVAERPAAIASEPGWEAPAVVSVEPPPPPSFPVSVPSLPRPTSQAAGTKRQSGTVLTWVGAAVALLGCALPLASGGGESISVVALVRQDVPYAILVPASAVAIAVLGAVAGAGLTHTRALLGGTVIALSSPWTVLWALVILAVTRAVAALGPFSFGADLGAGAMALAIGFGVSLAGGFAIISDATAER